MGNAFGNVGRRVLQLFVMLNNVRVLIVYMIIIEQRYLRLKWLLFADVYEGVQVYGAHQCA
ncbi:hypothetical protein NC651_025970 [Populus alba x Populus x berolinensis]|nr:hypothetical protein NC651_024729 [Populus alba x Populus x berolinensis]KAJ6892920.1 hypothetical protein NC651_025970 [Populus alba x Populus x berolinensis]